MLPALAPLARQFAFGGRMLDRLVGDFAVADWAVRDAAGHDARWIVGHCAAMRLRLLALTGAPVPDAPWAVHFARGTRPEAVPAEVAPGDLLAAFHAAGAALAARWEALTEPDLARPLGRALPDGGDDTGGALRFLAWHEAYHLGQLGLLRRLAGRAGAA